MKEIYAAALLYFALLIQSPVQCQTTGEWVVEMNPSTGSFEAVGPVLFDIWTIFVGLQCKDETNGQYIFMQAGPSRLISVDISNAEMIANTPNPLGNQGQLIGFNCLGNCDTLVMLCRDNQGAYTYLAHFDRFTGTDVIPVGDSIPIISPPGAFGTFICETFDPVLNQVYMYSEYASTIHVLNADNGEILSVHEVTASPQVMAYDEINGALFAIQPAGSSSLKLLRFDTELGDFIQVGENISTMSSGHTQATIDGNNQRMFVTRTGAQGSFMTSIDLLTGDLLVDAQTMPALPDGNPLGGPNTVNGRYFNSTDQLITLHWGTGSGGHTTSTTSPDADESSARVFPNPNRGNFKIDLGKSTETAYSVKIINLKGQLVHESHNIAARASVHTNLPPGYYTANVSAIDGTHIARIPLVIRTDQ